MADNPQDVPQGPYVGTSDMSNVNPMLDDSNKVVTSHAALTSDNVVLGVANSKTAVRFWDAGVWKNGTPNTGDMIIFTDVITVAGGAGDATFYLTSNHLSSGTALCSSIMVNSVRGGWVDQTGNYNSGQPTITSNKTIVVPSSKQGTTSLVVLGLNVLGAITYPGSPNGTTVTLFAIGISV